VLVPKGWDTVCMFDIMADCVSGAVCVLWQMDACMECVARGAHVVGCGHAIQHLVIA
jgi:hypothetical protein